MTEGDRQDAGLRNLYQEIILDHYRKPRNRGEIPGTPLVIHMNNPTCGDEITLGLQMEGDRISAARFKGHGCSISQASASMMTQLVEGKDDDATRQLAAQFRSMMHGESDVAGQKELGDARALAGVARFPARVRCALLPWNALESLLDSRREEATG